METSLTDVGTHRPVLERDAVPQPLQGCARSTTPVDLGQIGLRHLIRGVGQPLREVPVVGQDQQPSVSVSSRPTWNSRSLPSRPHLAIVGRAYGRPSGIVHGGDDAARLVQHQIDVPARRRDARAVDPDHVALGVDPDALLGHQLAVHLDPTLADQLLAGPPGGDPGRRPAPSAAGRPRTS